MSGSHSDIALLTHRPVAIIKQELSRMQYQMFSSSLPFRLYQSPPHSTQESTSDYTHTEIFPYTSTIDPHHQFRRLSDTIPHHSYSRVRIAPFLLSLIVIDHRDCIWPHSAFPCILGFGCRKFLDVVCSCYVYLRIYSICAITSTFAALYLDPVCCTTCSIMCTCIVSPPNQHFV